MAVSLAAGRPEDLVAASQQVPPNWSFGFTFKPRVAPSGVQNCCFNFGRGGTALDCGYLHDHAAASFRDAVFWRNTTGTYYTAQVTTVPGEYNFIGGSFDATNLKAYLGTNAPVSTAIAGSQSTGTHAFAICNVTVGTQSMDGDLGEFGYWNVALSDDEFASMGRGLSPLLIRPSKLESYYSLVKSEPVALDRTGLRHLARSGVGQIVTAAHPRVINPQAGRATYFVPVVVSGIAANIVDWRRHLKIQ